MSQTITFYKVALRRCYKCNKPAAYQIQATGNVPYDYTCDRHAATRVRELTAAYKTINRSLSQDGAK